MSVSNADVQLSMLAALNGSDGDSTDAVVAALNKLHSQKVRTLMKSINDLKEQVEAAKRIGAQAVELHTGIYAEDPQPRYVSMIRDAAMLASQLDLEVHAGHGLNYDNVTPIAAIHEVVELNIGHFLMGEAMFVGIRNTISHMRALMDKARSS